MFKTLNKKMGPRSGEIGGYPAGIEADQRCGKDSRYDLRTETAAREVAAL